MHHLVVSYRPTRLPHKTAIEPIQLTVTVSEWPLTYEE